MLRIFPEGLSHGGAGDLDGGDQLVTHLPLRTVMDTAGYSRLQAFCDDFGRRARARQTVYRFDGA